MWGFLLPIFGFFIGLVAAMTGIGGGVFIVPLLVLLYSFSPATAVGTSLAAIFLTATAATINYSYQKKVNFKTGLLLSLTTAPGALLGAYLTSITPSQILGIVFGAFVFVVALRILTKNIQFPKRRNKFSIGSTINQQTETKFSSDDRLIVGIALSFSGGLVSGLLGVGGGVILVPIMTIIIGMTIHSAVATSMFAIAITSIFEVGQHYSLGNINIEYALLVGLGSVVGAQFGAYISKNISGINLQRIFGIILLLVSFQMLLKFA